MCVCIDMQRGREEFADRCMHNGMAALCGHRQVDCTEQALQTAMGSRISRMCGLRADVICRRRTTCSGFVGLWYQSDQLT